jgi:hypothetical protein
MHWRVGGVRPGLLQWGGGLPTSEGCSICCHHQFFSHTLPNMNFLVGLNALISRVARPNVAVFATESYYLMYCLYIYIYIKFGLMSYYLFAWVRRAPVKRSFLLERLFTPDALIAHPDTTSIQLNVSPPATPVQLPRLGSGLGLNAEPLRL